MKLYQGILLGALVLGLSGCATVYQSMGIATTTEMASRDQKIAELEKKVGDLESQIAEAQSLEQRVKSAEALAQEADKLSKELAGKMDTLPQATLKRIAALLAQAAEDQNP